VPEKEAVIIKAPLATARASLRVGSVHLFVCLCVCLSPTINAIFSKSKQFRVLISIDDQEVPHGLFKEPIIRLLKFKMAEIHNLENRKIAISQRKIIGL